MAIIPIKNKRGTSYQVKVRDHTGRWFPTPSLPNREMALLEEARLLKLKRSGAKALSDDARNVTFEEYWEVWSVENRERTSEGWKISQDQMFRDYAKPVLGELKMSEIGTPEIGKTLKRVRELGRSDQMVKHVYSLLRSMFGDAVEYYEMLTTNPVKAKHHRPRVSKEKRDFLVPAQAWHLLESCRSSYLGPAVWLELLAALRSEAALALDWGSVQWDQDQILICRGWKAKVRRIENYPKGKDWEYVPMVPRLKEYLLEVWEFRGRPAKGFVCLNHTGARMLSYHTYLKALRRLCRAAGVPTMTTHELRHSCTEIWVDAGANAEDLRRLLNHANAATTMNYIHRTDVRLQSLAERVGQETEFQNKFQNRNLRQFETSPKGVPNVH